jgi:hypothetical protein
MGYVLAIKNLRNALGGGLNLFEAVGALSFESSEKSLNRSALSSLTVFAASKKSDHSIQIEGTGPGIAWSSKWGTTSRYSAYN